MWNLFFVYPLIRNDNGTDFRESIEEGIAYIYDANYQLIDVVTDIPGNKGKGNIVIVKAQLDTNLQNLLHINQYKHIIHSINNIKIMEFVNIIEYYGIAYFRQLVC